MSVRIKRVYGNWKMNLTSKEVKSLVSELHTYVAPVNSEVGVFPGFPYIQYVSESNSKLRIGAQNFYPLEQGAYTGEVSVLQIKDVGADMVLIGHSERRALFHEDHSFLKKKVDVALDSGIMPVFCCGEPFEIRQAANEMEFVQRQLNESLFHLSEKQLLKCVIAYEPVWAIGTGMTATTEQAEDMHAAIRNWISEKYGAEIAQSISIIYGGSCNASNASELFACPNVDGGLIGGASLKSDSFKAIIEAL